MPIAHVQTSSETIISGASSGNISMTTTAGNFGALYIAQVSTNVRNWSASGGGTWVVDKQQNGSSPTNVSAIASCQNLTGGASTITATADGNCTARIVAQEFSGLPTSGNPTGTDSSVEAAATSHLMGTTGVTTTNESLIFGVMCSNNVSYGTRTPGTGYTQITSGSNAVMYQYGIFATAQTNNQAPFTCANSVTGVGAMGAYEVSSAAPPGRVIYDGVIR